MKHTSATAATLAGGLGILLIGAYFAMRQHTRYRSCVIANQLIASTRVTNPSATTSICGVRGATWALLAAGVVVALLGAILLVAGYRRRTAP